MVAARQILSMKSLSYAIVTPSFRLDMQRCKFLVESVQRWVASDVRHYLVVDRRDVPMFKPMISSRTELLVVEQIIPWWLMRIPGFRRFWFSLRTRPVKNWILQQIVKLSVPGAVSEDVLLYADSDMFFIAPLDPRTFERDGKVPLLFNTGQRGLIPSNDAWQAVAAKLLGLPVEQDSDINYVGNVIWWRRENVLAALERIQEHMGKGWQRAIAPLAGFSEYILYGVYCHRVLGAASGHWYDDVNRTLTHWGTTPLDINALEALSAERGPEIHSVMVSAKSRTPIADIRQVFREPVPGQR